MMTKPLIVAATLLLAAQPLLAQNKTVYRCEEASGRVAYSDESCKGGVALKNDDARSDQQRQAASEALLREEKLGRTLANERRAEEKHAATQPKGAAIIAYPAAEKAAKEPPVDEKRAAKKKKTQKAQKTQKPKKTQKARPKEKTQA
jgi:hypothetical protein